MMLVFLAARHYDDVTWMPCSLKSPVVRVFVWQLMQTHCKETPKSALLVLYEGNPPVTGEIPAQRVSNEEEKASIWWRHRVIWLIYPYCELFHYCGNHRVAQVPVNSVDPGWFEKKILMINYQAKYRYWWLRPSDGWHWALLVIGQNWFR